jgi:hypothetical protein
MWRHVFPVSCLEVLKFAGSAQETVQDLASACLNGSRITANPRDGLAKGLGQGQQFCFRMPYRACPCCKVLRGNWFADFALPPCFRPDDVNYLAALAEP